MNKKIKLTQKASKLKTLSGREPFRAFAVRLRSGAVYQFDELRDFGAVQDFHLIVHFGRDFATSIYTDEITEIVPAIK
jgi:hypothetical protein